MTREEAITIIKPLMLMMKNPQGEVISDAYYALEMAIQALEQEPCDVFDKYGNYKYPSDVELTEPNTATSMPSGDLISRSGAIKAIEERAKQIKNEDTLNGLAGAVGILFELPSVKPQEKAGHWIGIDEEPHEDYECDKCGYTVSTYTANIEPHTEYKFCPNCGARMFEPQESEVRNEKDTFIFN